MQIFEKKDFSRPCLIHKNVVLINCNGGHMNKIRFKNIICLLVFFFVFPILSKENDNFYDMDFSHTISVGPYLETATPSSIWIMWETTALDESVVEWGTTSLLGNITSGTSKDGYNGSKIHEVQLVNLMPDTSYFYRVKTEYIHTSVLSFKTPPLISSNKTFRFAVYSDNQERPHIHKAIFENGLLETLKKEGTGNISEDLALVLNAGDIVVDGDKYHEYKERYFDPHKTFSSRVPFYVAIGNHEKNSKYFFNYFHTPQNGSEGYEEHWYSFDYSNVHFIALDTNYSYRKKEQLMWLRKDLHEACSNPHTDFIFAFFHHPFLSESWIKGETKYSGDIIKLMEDYLNKCGKAGAHFFGHSHSYSRGQSKDANFFWVGVAAAGGYLDYWGDFKQKDHEVYQKTFDELGYVLVDVAAGPNPSFQIRRFTFGDPNNPKVNELQDDFTFSYYKEEPLAPRIYPINSNCVIKASEFIDQDGGTHLATHWQISKWKINPMFKHGLLYEKWVRFENWYNGDKSYPSFNKFADVNTQEGADITKHKLPVNELKPLFFPKTYFIRVRYRDSDFRWSEWSNTGKFIMDRHGTCKIPSFNIF